jgi:hypothetical protein
MSFNLEDAAPGDILVLTSNWSNHSLKVGELLGKFIVVSKERSEANNNNNPHSKGLTLHIIQAKESYPPLSNNIGRNCSFSFDQMDVPILTWKLDYRPEEE